MDVVEEACMFDIMDIPAHHLKAVIPKLSARMTVRLLCAYPRALGRALLTALSETMSPPTLEFLKEEMLTTGLPSVAQIREAELEFLKVANSENLLPQHPH
jgi:hypothetical protein